MTPKRVELFKMLSEFEPHSIRELAEVMERDVKNIWDDLKLLENFGLISFQAEGRIRRPIVRKQIIITLVEVRR